MRILVRLGAVLVVVLAIAIGALLVFLPGYANSPAVRERISAAAFDALGREVRYADLTFGLVPPRLVVTEPSVAGERAQDERLLEAQEVALELALGPLLARKVVIDSLVIEGATLRLVRTKDGIVLPKPRAEAPAGAKKGDPPAAGKPAPAAEEDSGAGFALELRDLQIRNTRIVLEDRSVSPNVTWDLKGIDGSAELGSDRLVFEIEGGLGSGGKIHAKGKAGEKIDAVATLTEVVMAPLAPYLGDAAKIAGALSGTISLRGPRDAPDAVDADLVLSGGNVAIGDLAVKGKVSVKANLTGGLEKPQGKFDLDATSAELSYGEAFSKPPGTPATTTGRIISQPDGTLGIEDVHLKIHNMDAKAKVRSGARTHAELRAPAFDLRGWDKLIPALAEASPTGTLAFQDFGVSTNPTEFKGKLQLGEIVVRVPEREPVTVRGAIAGAGRALQLSEMTLTAAQQTIRVSGDVKGFDATPRFDIRVKADGADTERLLAAFTPMRDTLYGALSLDANLAGPIGGDRPIHETLGGQVKFQITEGRLKSVSLLKGTFDSMGGLGEAAMLAGQLKGGKTLQRFYEDEFESIRGTLDVSSGLAKTNDLRLTYRHYTVDMRGGIRLADQSFDNMKAIVTINEEVDQALQEGQTPGREQVLNIGIAGTVAKPRPVVTAEAVRGFVASRSVGRQREKIEERVDEYLGKGAGRDLLDGLLGGGRR